jgi:transcriptional regulator with XRE-family HTH domain
MDFSGKVRAARAILNWSREELAKRAGLSVTGIHKIENNEANPKAQTIHKLEKAINAAGVEFTEDGIKQPENTVTNLSGEHWYLEMLDDAYYSLLDRKDAELLIEYSDDRLSPPEVIASYRKIHSCGIRIRQLTIEGNTYLPGPVNDYKWIPANYFRNYLRITYANKVCLDVGDRGILINSPIFAEAAKHDFDLKWHLLPELEVESTANVRF